MNENNIRTLTSALRSGEYTQIPGLLGEVIDTENGVVGNCCLGVASILAGCQPNPSEPVEQYAKIYYDDEETVAPRRARDWMGTESANPDVDWPGDLVTPNGDDYICGASIGQLAALNDGGFTFTQIADIIDYFGIR